MEKSQPWMKMYIHVYPILKMAIFHCDVSFQGSKWDVFVFPTIF